MKECEVKCHTGWSVTDDKWIHYSHSRQRATHGTISVTHQSEKSLRGSRVGMEQSDLLSVQMESKLISFHQHNSDNCRPGQIKSFQA